MVLKLGFVMTFQAAQEALFSFQVLGQASFFVTNSSTVKCHLSICLPNGPCNEFVVQRPFVGLRTREKLP